MKKREQLLEAISHMVYFYRKNNGKNGTAKTDWTRAERMIENWKKEYIIAEDKKAVVLWWCDHFYDKYDDHP